MESGRTAAVAKKMADVIGADLNYINPIARCNREFMGKKEVPVSGRVEHFNEYELVLIGFPIWYGCAPNVVNTFCKGYDWSSKKGGIFATSGGSMLGKIVKKLEPYVKGAEIVDARLMNGAGEREMKEWVM